MHRLGLNFGVCVNASSLAHRWAGDGVAAVRGASGASNYASQGNLVSNNRRTRGAALPCVPPFKAEDKVLSQCHLTIVCATTITA